MASKSGRSRRISASSSALRRATSSARGGGDGASARASPAASRVSLSRSAPSSHVYRANNKSRPGSAVLSYSPWASIRSSSRCLRPNPINTGTQDDIMGMRLFLSSPLCVHDRGGAEEGAGGVLHGPLLDVQWHVRRPQHGLELAGQPVHQPQRLVPHALHHLGRGDRLGRRLGRPQAAHARTTGSTEVMPRARR
jgi:hypothetical protein